MAGDKGSPWQRIFEGATSPGQLASIALGAGGGALVTVVTHGLDLGSSIAAGASIGLAAWNGLLAAITRRSPKAQVKGLVDLINTEIKKLPENSSARGQFRNLLDQVEREGRLLKAKSLSAEEFADRFKTLVAMYRQICESPSPPPST